MVRLSLKDRVDSYAAPSDSRRSLRRQRKNSRHELIEKRAGLHKHRKVSASLDRDERLRWRPDGIDEGVRETPGGGEVFSALNHEDRNSEVAGERSRVEPTCLRDQAFGTDTLTLEPVVDIAHRITRRSKGEADHREDERVRTLEEIGPFALHAVPTTIRIWRRPNLAQLSNGALILKCSAFVKSSL